MKHKIIFSSALSLFWVIFMWGFWERGVYALGVNAFVYGALLLWFLIWVMDKNGWYQKSDRAWIIPLLLMALSFVLFENPFFKAFNLLVFFPALAFFYNRPWHKLFNLLASLGQSARLFFSFATFKDDDGKALA